jgi:hypothetical protein
MVKILISRLRPYGMEVRGHFWEGFLEINQQGKREKGIRDDS